MSQPATAAKAAQNTKPAATAAKAAGVQITYRPNSGDPVSVTWGKLLFEANKPRLVSDPRIIERAKTNPWFKVEGEKQADKGFDPATDTPVNASQYRGYVIAWLKTVNKSADLVARWSAEEELRTACEVGTDDLEYIARFYDPRLEQLRKMEAAGDAR